MSTHQTSPPQPPIEHVSCDSAVDFLQAISPRGPYFSSESAPNHSIFRGHGNDGEYQLIPSVLRPQNSYLLQQLSRNANRPLEMNKHQILAEIVVIRDFLQASDA